MGRMLTAVSPEAQISRSNVTGNWNPMRLGPYPGWRDDHTLVDTRLLHLDNAR